MDTQAPILTRDQIRRVDQLAVSDLAIPSLILMENAGKNAADWIRDRYGGRVRAVYVFCGPGNNGGDGLVIARHLHNARLAVEVHLVGDVARLSADSAANHAIVQRMGLPVHLVPDTETATRAVGRLTEADLVVDALLGTGFSGDVREPLAELIRRINAATVRSVIAIDVPSGLDCATGAVGNVAVHADTTITFVALKTGFAEPAARRCLGAVVVRDIGTPPELTERVRQEC